MKIKVTSDYSFTVYIGIDTYGNFIDVKEEDYNRWIKVIGEYHQIQQEIDEIARKQDIIL